MRHAEPILLALAEYLEEAFPQPDYWLEVDIKKNKAEASVWHRTTPDSGQQRATVEVIAYNAGRIDVHIVWLKDGRSFRMVEFHPLVGESEENTVGFVLGCVERLVFLHMEGLLP